MTLDALLLAVEADTTGSGGLGSLPSIITALVAGIVAILGAVSALNTKRGKADAQKLKLFTGRVTNLEKQNVAMVSHIHKLEVTIAGAGGEVPPRPPILNEPIPPEVYE